MKDSDDGSPDSLTQLGKCGSCRVRGLNPAFCFGFCTLEGESHTVEAKAGNTLFYAGDMPQGLYKIKSGLVKTEITSPNGNCHILRIKRPGEILGYSMFANEPYKATAIVIEDCALCFVSREHVLEQLSRKPHIAIMLLGQLAQELRFAEYKWINQIDKEAHERVAEAILFLHDQFPNQHWTRREIGEWTGTTPETVMRAISILRKKNLISTKGRKFQILDRTLLTQIVR